MVILADYFNHPRTAKIFKVSDDNKWRVQYLKKDGNVGSELFTDRKLAVEFFNKKRLEETK